MQLRNLQVKYWGNALSKSVGIIGNPIEANATTMIKDRTRFVRYLVKMDIGGMFPELIEFQSEQRILIQQRVECSRNQ